MASIYREWADAHLNESCRICCDDCATIAFDAGRAAVQDSGGELPERPKHISNFWRRGAVVEETFVTGAAAYMDALEAEIARLREAGKAALWALTCAETVFGGELGTDWADGYWPEFMAIEKARDLLTAPPTPPEETL